MNNFGILYRYECKKLLGKKIVWISFVLCLVAIVITICAPMFGEYYLDGEMVDTNYNMYLKDKMYSEKLNGREIDHSLLEETMEAYRKIPDISDKHYSATEEYQNYARPYSPIFNFLRNATGMTISEALQWTPSEKDLYVKRQGRLEEIWQSSYLSDEEIEFWQKQETQIATPYVYNYHEGYFVLIRIFQTVGILLLMLLSVCLAGIFPDEHTRKTDQIILCSSLGKSKLYLAKIAAGISFATISTIIFFVFALVTTICLYGTSGFQTAFQFIYVGNSNPITCGQAVIIAYGNMLITAIIISVFVMVLSELLHNNIATLAISTALIIVTMVVSMPEQYRTIAQVWDWLPWRFLSPWNVFGQYTFSLFENYFTPWQSVPMIYMIASAIIIAFGKPIYQRFQISGR